MALAAAFTKHLMRYRAIMINTIRGVFERLLLSKHSFLKATRAVEDGDGWTFTTKKDGSYVAQHEHTIVVTDGQPIILTAADGIWD